MKLVFNSTLIGSFIERLNRFVGVVALEQEGEHVNAHIATSGRLQELLVAGAPALLEKSLQPERRTQYNLKAVMHNGGWVSIDAQAPNRLIEKALRYGALPAFSRCEFIRREPPHGSGRLDFLLMDNGRPVYIEVKSVTLMESGVALFPDAPTERGRRHLDDLSSLVKDGFRAAVIFVVQREDAGSFAPNGRTDVSFAAALLRAAAAGVEIYAYRCLVKEDGIMLGERLPVMI